MYTICKNNINQLMLFLCRGRNEDFSFRLSSDVAGNFNNLQVECYDQHQTGSVYYFVEHTIDRRSGIEAGIEASKNKVYITEEKLLSDVNKEFAVERYFTLYRNIKKTERFIKNNVELNSFVVCTNIDVDKDAKDMFNVVDKSDLLCSSNETSERLQFRQDMKLKLLEKFKAGSQFQQMAKSLAGCVRVFDETNKSKTKKRIELQNDLHLRNQGFLVSKILDVDKDLFQDNFFDSPELENFRNLFLEFLEIPSNLEAHYNVNEKSAVWNNVKELAKYVNVKDKKFTSVYFSKLFNKYVDFSSDDEEKFYESLKKSNLVIKKEFKKKPAEKIEKKTELIYLLKELMEAFEEGNEAVLGIDEKKRTASGKPCTIKLADLNELAGYVIVKDKNAGSKAYKFNPIFFNGDLPDDIKQFRERLFSIFNNRSIDEFMKHEYKFTAEKFAIFGEAQINSFLDPNLPNDEVSDGEVDAFLKNFMFAVGRPHDAELNKSISEQLESIIELKVIDNNSTFEYIQTNMVNWLTDISESKSFFKSSSGIDSFKEIEQNFVKVKLDLLQLTGRYIENISKFPVAFKNGFEEILQFLNNSDKQIFNVDNQCDVVLTTTKVLQVCNDIYKKENCFMFIDLKWLTNLQEYFIPKYIKCNVLLVDTDNEESVGDIRKLYDDFKTFLKLNSKNKLVIISSTKKILFEMFKEEYSINNKYVEYVDVSNNYINLSHNTQERLLKETSIEFYGKPVKLDKLISDDFHKIISSDVLRKIIKNEKIVVGRRCELSVDEIYVEQTVTRHVEIDNNIKKDTENFVQVNQRNSIFNPQNQDILCISNDNEYFTRLCNQYENYNVHQLNDDENAGTLIWQQSRRNLDKLQNYRIKPIETSQNQYQNNPKLLDANSIKDGNGSVIVAETGIGKTTLLKHLAQTIEMVDEDGNVLWIDIIDLVILERKGLLGTNKVQDAGAFLREGIYLNTDEPMPFQIELFSHYFKKMDLVLLFDGFEEISFESKRNAIEILSGIKHHLKKCWITCCPCDMQYDLEKALNTFSYTLQPINVQLYMHRYLTEKIHVANPEGIASEIEVLLRTNKPPIGKSLQIHMTAEVLKEMLKGCFNKTPDIVKQTIKETQKTSILYTRYFELKLGKEATNGAKWTQHMHVALLERFNENEIGELLKKSEIVDMKNIGVNANDVAAVIKMFRGSLRFNHPTFAEYFTALWLSRNWKNRTTDEDDGKVLSHFLRNHLFTAHNAAIHNFFNNFLITDENAQVKYELLNLVLSNNITQIQMLDENYLTELLEVKDKGDRTPLHLAAICGYPELCKLLISKVEVKRKIYILAKDSIFCWSALSYALKCEHWEICELLLNDGANDEDVVNFMDGDDVVLLKKTDDADLLNSDRISEIFRQKLNKRRNKALKIAAEFGYTKLVAAICKRCEKLFKCEEALHEAIKQGRLDIVKLLLSKKANPDVKDYSGKNSMHLAAQSGNIDMFCLLLDASDNHHNEIDEKGNTPLHYAIEGGHSDIVKQLVLTRADLTIKNKSGQQAKDMNPKFHDSYKLLINSRAAPNKERLTEETNKGGTTLLCFGRKSKRGDKKKKDK